MDNLGLSEEKVQQEMVDASKILTVSYGTFSCTLEGFDDPFSTMKGISEYFRNLASEDRMFGAEPPKLDTEMLKHIAETNTRASVSAEMGSNAVTLRPTAASVEAPQEVVPEPEVEEVVEAEAPEVPEQNEVSEQHQVVEVEETPDVAETAPEDTAPEDVVETPEAEAAPQDVAEAPAEEPAEEPTEVAVAKELDTLPDAEDDTETVTDRLARIRAAVAQDAEAEDLEIFTEAYSAAYSEDQHAEEISQSAENSIAALLADDHITPPSDLDAPPDSFEVTDLDEGSIDDGAPIETIEDTAPVAPPPTPSPKPAPIARAMVTRVLKSARDMVKPPAAEPEAPATDDMITPEDEAEMLASLAQVQADTAQRLAKALPATALNDADDMERLFDATQTRFDGAETSRAHANISHLKAAVAARNADAAVPQVAQPDDTEAYRDDLADVVKSQSPSPNEAPAAAQPEPTSPLVLVSEQRVSDGSDDDLDDGLDDHTFENLAAPTPEETAPQAGKILPRRVRRAMTDSFESDRETLASVAAAAGDGHSDTGSGFEGFAAELGAKELVDILEAAAAYSQMVQGSESFSRPKLLHLAMEADETFSREEGLRSFGQLLRNGTIKKIKRGAFELTRTSRYAEPAAKRSAS